MLNKGALQEFDNLNQMMSLSFVSDANTQFNKSQYLQLSVKS